MPVEMDLDSRDSIRRLIAEAQKCCKCPAGRPATADEIAHLAEIMLGKRGAFITGSDFLIDGGATASFFYGPLRPKA